MDRRIPASERTREALHDLIEGQLSSEFGRTELVKLATRLIVEEGLEAEVRDATDQSSRKTQSQSTSSPGHQPERRQGVEKSQRLGPRYESPFDMTAKRQNQSDKEQSFEAVAPDLPGDEIKQPERAESHGGHLRPSQEHDLYRPLAQKMRHAEDRCVEHRFGRPNLLIEVVNAEQTVDDHPICVHDEGRVEGERDQQDELGGDEDEKDLHDGAGPGARPDHGLIDIR